MFRKEYVLYITVFLLIFSCSTKKNTFKNRSYHKMTAWFNTLFNGQEAMDKKLEELEQSYQDDYFSTLTVNPHEEFKINDEAELIDAPQPQGQGIKDRLLSGKLMGEQQASSRTGFEKAEEKALKAISKHSMMVRGEERNKLMARAYLMLGQARYYQGKPFQALDALEQVQKLKFDKHTEAAKFYAVLANIQASNKFAAVEILDELYANDDLEKELKAKVAKEYAWLYYKESDLISALNGLDKALEFSKGKKEKARLNFIQAQILTELGESDKAIAKFNEAYRLKPGFEMEARAQIFAAMNFDPMVHNYASFKKNLIDSYKTGTYETYRNEFLYALAKIEQKRDSMALAEKTFKNALKEEQSDPRFRAETYAALGDINFNQDDYVYAAAYYDSATQVVPEGKRKEEITKFRDNLKLVMDKYYLVKRNDSILMLTQMPKAKRETYFQNYIEKLKESDAKKAEEENKVEEETKFLTRVDNTSNFSQSFNSSKGKFYFYSNSAKNNGEIEFKQKWGNRRLADHWRLSNAGTVSIEQQKAELTGNVNTNNPRRYDVAFYIEQIPVQDSVINQIKIERDTVELSLGLDYADQFKNYKRATETLEHLVQTPPKEDDVLMRAYYNLYRINANDNKTLSEKYKNLILEKYPTSLYAEYILNPQSDFTEGNNPEVLAMYNDAYNAYKEEDFKTTQTLIQSAYEKYPKAEIIAKFLLLKAFVDARLSGKEAYIESLKTVMLLYPKQEEGLRAKELLDDLNKDTEPKEKDAEKDAEKESFEKTERQARERKNEVSNEEMKVEQKVERVRKTNNNKKDQDLRKGQPGVF